MTEEDIKYFSKFLKEFQSETDRGAALVGAALIDERLERILNSHFVECKQSDELLNGVNSPLGTLNARAKLSYCLGLITTLEFKEIEIIRQVRNLFAHKVIGLTFNSQKVSDMCKNLKANFPETDESKKNARSLFINSVILTSLALWYRPEHSSKFKSEERVWKYQLST